MVSPATVPKWRFFTGFRVFLASCVFTGAIVSFVLLDERWQRDRRKANVRYRINSIQQKQNMAEYETQRQKFEDYKTQHS
ncbi:Protein C25H3.17 [Aphelenchoides avenae]|nr:Protein C25H3.17 [Aphelenchus avenae]